MTQVLRSLGAAVVIATLATATTASAASPEQKCGKAKSLIAAKLFTTFMKCLTRQFTDPAFDSAHCGDEAEAKCVEGFARADAKFAPECRIEGNGPSVCGQARDAAADVYGNI